MTKYKVIENDLPESEEVLKLQRLIEQAKEQALKEDAILNFDPQGRLLIDVDDYVVSLDVAFNEALKKKYFARLQEQLDAALQIHPKENIKSSDIVSALDRLPTTNSIIFLQQEMHFHLSLVLNVYKKQLKNISKDYNVSFETMKKVNSLVMQAFAEALIEATDGKGIDIEKLNSYLDSKRIEIAERAHDFLLEELVQQFDLDIEQFDFETAQEDAAHTTATNKSILHVDRHLNTLTEIEGSQITSHTRTTGNKFAHRAVKTYRIDENLRVQNKLHGRQIRTPSLPVKKGLSEQEYIDDTVVKIEKLVNSYSLSKPFTYNLFTAMQHRFDDIGTNNKQTQSARHIILGAHAYNRKVCKNKTDSYCLIQAISVNGFGRPLGYHNFGLSVRLPNEATLLAEMSLCYNMGDESILDDYKKFLAESNSSKNIWEEIRNYFKSPYFVSSQQGQDLQKKIAAQKIQWQGAHQVDESDNTDLVKTSLQKIMAYDLHFSHDYAKLIQTLSIFIEDESILGCKSGNERTPIIMEREQLLKQINIPDDLREAFKGVAHAATKERTVKALDNLKLLINKYYNEENLYGASALMPLVDQGAGHKISAKNGYELDSNKAEDQKSEGIKNLQQKNTRALQAHNDLPNFMRDAIIRRQSRLTITSENITEITKGSYAIVSLGLASDLKHRKKEPVIVAEESASVTSKDVLQINTETEDDSEVHKNNPRPF